MDLTSWFYICIFFLLCWIVWILIKLTQLLYVDIYIYILHACVQWLLNNMSTWLNRTMFSRIPFLRDFCLGSAWENSERFWSSWAHPESQCRLVELQDILWISHSPVGVGITLVQRPSLLEDLVSRLLQILGQVWEDNRGTSLMPPISNASFLLSMILWLQA